MSIVTDPSTTKAADDQWRLGLRWTLFLPVFAGAFALGVPHWSVVWTVVVCSLIALDVALMVLVVYRGRYASPHWRGAYVVYTLDLFAFFFLVVVVRNAGAPTWADAVLIGLFAAVLVLAHHFRRAVAQELLAPRTRIGRAFAAFGAVGAAGAGMLGYASGAAGVGVVYFAAILVLVISHAMWTKAEDPDWQPEPAARRRA